MLPDGAFSTLDDGALCFVRIAAPTVEDLERILARVIRRTTRMLVSRGLLEEPDPEDALAHLQAESLQAGLPWRLENQRSATPDGPWSSTPLLPLSASLRCSLLALLSVYGTSAMIHPA